jgi:hypothetical protein
MTALHITLAEPLYDPVKFTPMLWTYPFSSACQNRRTTYSAQRGIDNELIVSARPVCTAE